MDMSRSKNMPSTPRTSIAITMDAPTHPAKSSAAQRRNSRSTATMQTGTKRSSATMPASAAKARNRQTSNLESPNPLFPRNIFRVSISSGSKKASSAPKPIERLCTISTKPMAPARSEEPSKPSSSPKAATPDSREAHLSPIGQQIQEDARKNYSHRLDQKSARELEAAVQVQAEQARIHALKVDLASLSHIQKATARLSKLTHCTPPFEPTLWRKPSRGTGTTISEGYEVVSPFASPPSVRNGVTPSSAGLFSPTNNIVRPESPSAFSDSAYKFINTSPPTTPNGHPQLHSGSTTASDTSSPSPSPSLALKPFPRPTTPPKRPVASPTPGRNTLSPRRDRHTGALQLSQQGSLIARLPGAEKLDPQGWNTQQWLEGAIASAMETPEVAPVVGNYQSEDGHGWMSWSESDDSAFLSAVNSVPSSDSEEEEEWAQVKPITATTD